MNILAIDTTTAKASVALKIKDDIYVKEITNEITHSEKLLPLVDSILQDAKVTLNDIELFAVTQGPGSFTGVRIGIATIKAFAKVTNKPIFGTTSLQLLAIDGIKKSKTIPSYVLSLMDAKNNRAYYNLFRYENNNLISLDFAGNDYIDNVLETIPNFALHNLLITVDNKSINIKNSVHANLDLTNIFKLDLSDNLYNYINLDAMYYRKSEAERTKEGE